MAEIKLTRRVKYAGDIVDELIKAGWDFDTAVLFVNNLPDAKDRVEVVRCGKCKSRPKGEYGMCHKLCRQTHEDDFCSYGDRRTDG